MKYSDQVINRNSREYVNILGINLLSTSKARLLASIRHNISHNAKNPASRHKFFILTPNPELLLMAQNDLELKKALNSADFAVPDGIGLAQAAAYLKLNAVKIPIVKEIQMFFQGIAVGLMTFFKQVRLTESLNVIKGRELFLDLIRLSNKKKLKVFFLGGLGDEAEKAKKTLRLNYKAVKIDTFAGPFLEKNGEPVGKENILLFKESIEKINSFSPDLLFVAFGNPKQEKFIFHNLQKLNLSGAMAVGGTFRYIVGKSKLPPKVFERLGLEWVFRLFTEPSRLSRIINAWPRFPLAVFLSRLERKD